MMKPPKNQNSARTTTMTISIAIGLGLGVLFGSMADDIVRCMTIGAAVGLCGGSAVGALKGKKEGASDEERKSNDK